MENKQIEQHITNFSHNTAEIVIQYTADVILIKILIKLLGWRINWIELDTQLGNLLHQLAAQIWKKITQV